MDQKIVVQILRAPAGGIRKHVYDILETLTDQNCKQIFISHMSLADYPIHEHANLKIIDLKIEDQPALSDLKNLFLIYWKLRNVKVDVVHGHGAKGGLYARLIAFPLRAKSIYTPHGGSLHRAYGRIKNFIFDLVELFLLPFTDVLLFESKYSQNMFFKNILPVPEKSIVNYNGIEIDLAPKQTVYSPGEKIKFVSFGLLRHLKGHDIGIETSRKLKAAGIPFSYTIFGKGEELENLLRLIKDNNLEEEVQIQSYTNKVYQEMQKYDVVYHPSRFEALPYVPVEAMFMKIPVIVSSVGGITEIVDESTGFISRENSSDEYFEVFKNLYEGKYPLPQMVENAYAKAQKHFSKRGMMAKLEELYKG